MLMFAVKARAEPVSRLLLRVATNKTMFYQNGSEASVNYNGLVNHRVVNRRSSVNRQPRRAVRVRLRPPPSSLRSTAFSGRAREIGACARRAYHKRAPEIFRAPCGLIL